MRSGPPEWITPGTTMWLHPYGLPDIEPAHPALFHALRLLTVLVGIAGLAILLPLVLNDVGDRDRE